MVVHVMWGCTWMGLPSSLHHLQTLGVKIRRTWVETGIHAIVVHDDDDDDGIGWFVCFCENECQLTAAVTSDQQDENTDGKNVMR